MDKETLEARDLELALQLQAMEFQKAKEIKEKEEEKEKEAEPISAQEILKAENVAEKVEIEVNKKHFKEKDEEIRGKEVKQTIKKKKEEGKAIREKKKQDQESALSFYECFGAEIYYPRYEKETKRFAREDPTLISFLSLLSEQLNKLDLNSKSNFTELNENLGVLAVLATQANYRTILRNNISIKTLIATLQKSEAPKTHGIAALANMALDGAFHQILVSNGAIKLAIDILKIEESEDNIQTKRHCGRLLAGIAGSGRFYTNIINEDGVQILFEIVTNPNTSKVVIKEALSALYQLSFESENFSSILRKQGLQPLVRFLKGKFKEVTTEIFRNLSVCKKDTIPSDILQSLEPSSSDDENDGENSEVNIPNPFNINWDDPDYQRTITFPVHRRYVKVVVFRSGGGKCHKPVIYLYPKETTQIRVTVKSEMPFIGEFPKMNSC